MTGKQPVTGTQALKSLFAGLAEQTFGVELGIADPPLLDYLSGHAQLRLLGPSEPTRRAPTVSVVVPGMTGAEAAAEMARHGLMCGGGDFYARRLIEALGVDPDSGVLRMSFLHYTAEEEIERLIEGLESLCRARSGRA